MAKTEVKKAKKKKEHVKNEFGVHEVLHTSSILYNNFEEYINAHPEVRADKELKKKAKRIAADLYDFYQLVGEKAL